MQHSLKKLIWGEGILLSQQHFQQWDQQLAMQQNLLLRQLQPFFWGLVELTVDESALQAGRFRIKTCTAIFPNGQLVQFNEAEQAVLSCVLEAELDNKVHVYLALPMNEQISGLSGYAGEENGSAWRAAYQQVADIYDQQRQQELAFALPNLCLLRGDQERKNYFSIKIAELIHQGNQQYRLATNFIPSVLKLSASPNLLALLGRLLELLEVKVNILQERKRNYDGDFVQFGASDLAHFLLLQALSDSLPILRHYHQQKNVHPVDLYLCLQSLLGRLESFTREETGFAYVDYQHQGLSQVFLKIERGLQVLIDQALPANMMSLALKKQSDAVLVVDHIETSLFDGFDFYLAVKVDSDDLGWIARFTQQVKLGSQSDIHAIVGSALAGLPIKHVQRPPNNLPIKSGYEYFYLEKLGELWQQVKQVKNLAIFLSYEFLSAKVELLSVKN